MNLLESRILDSEHERQDLLSQLTNANDHLDELRKQNSILFHQVEIKNKEILLLRGQIQLFTQNKTAQEVELASLRQKVCLEPTSCFSKTSLSSAVANRI